MTRFTKLTLAALVAFTPTLAQAQSQVLIQRHGGGDPAPLGLSATTPQTPTGPTGLVSRGGGAPTTTADNSVFCGNGEMFYWYEEDANGNEVPGTRQYGCDYD